MRNTLSATRRFTIAAVAAFAVLGAGCGDWELVGEGNPDTMSVTIHNDSDTPIVIVQGGKDLTDAALSIGVAQTRIRTVPPGGEQSRNAPSYVRDERGWCGGVTLWITRSRSGRHYDGELLTTPEQVADLELLDSIAPGRCWPKRRNNYHFTGA